MQRFRIRKLPSKETKFIIEEGLFFGLYWRHCRVYKHKSFHSWRDALDAVKQICTQPRVKVTVILEED